MKYIVKCKKVMQCIFVVDAADDLQADQKLLEGKYESKFETVKTLDSYFGWEYEDDKKYTGVGEQAVICSIEDLCSELGTTVDRIERDMYKNTACGMPIEWNERGVTLVGYVEGADCDGPSETLEFPFTMKEFNETVQRLEDAADEMWHEWNDVDETEGE
jgi:hypothetical protein